MYIWDYLKSTDKPIVLYGMGNGGDKIFDCCERYGININAVFSSDDRQSGAFFHSLPVVTLSKVLEQYPSPIILLAFGTERTELLERLHKISDKYEMLAPDVPLCGGPLITPEFIEKYGDNIYKARSLLSDDISRNVFDGLLEFKQSGKVSALFEIETPSIEKRSIISLSGEEVFLDLGAYTGDTIDEFLEWCEGKYSKIIAFEPDEKNFKKLSSYVENINNVSLHPYASWSEETELEFLGKGGRNCGIVNDIPGKKQHIHRVHAKSIDSLSEPITFAKLDVEGAEAETLIGMKNTINTYHPSFQISVYHKTDDFITLPLLLDSICPGYKMFLRHHPSLPAWELQLYCKY